MQELVESAVKDFVRTLGADDIAFPESGILQFSFERLGTFYIELGEGGALFYLVRELPDFGIEQSAEKALILCHSDQSQKYDTQCALMKTNHLLFLVFVTAEKLNGQEVESILRYLMKLHDVLAPS
ncbi:hypothetical protein M3P05_11560 [Sansalvadorimonas sp. 2012CJ34-2]|uniref:Uncharacterized protein n=1 Tax=Parendozoicomonas callyspongiae TaxID=2942213 RepID=A0ABT0PGP8_9GAMM|nr:hypothetical protein [Sansalvadorimonas sp. 2012CJ34-2]MCL6270560.1 hypothetical protein [Sansalvadorimonas sp. 2012CJ34-2]